MPPNSDPQLCQMLTGFQNSIPYNKIPVNKAVTKGGLHQFHLNRRLVNCHLTLSAI